MALNADIPSHGSGLASSSSFIISMVKAVSKFKGLDLSDYEICKISLNLERKFNPLVGRQDIFGCGLKGFKHLHFLKDNNLKITPLDNNYFYNFNFYLIPISKNGRKSTNILKSLNLEERKFMYNKVEEGIISLKNQNYKNFNNLILNSWEKKKLTSPLITTPRVVKLENDLKKIKFPIYYKLCGAGGGGYMLLISDRKNNLETLDFFNKNSYIKIYMDNKGIKTWTLD